MRLGVPMRNKLTNYVMVLGLLGGLTGIGSVCHGDSTVRTKAVKPIEGSQWFPDNLTTVFTNHCLYYVPDPVAFKNRPALKDCQRIFRGGTLKIYKGDGADDERNFTVVMLLSNAAMLSVHGTLQQKTVPLVFIDR